MSRTVTGGTYRRDTESDLYAVGNESTVLPSLAPSGPLPPQGTAATATLTRVPHEPYTVGSQVVYEDGNNNNTVHFRVTSVVGPKKYKLVVRL